MYVYSIRMKLYVIEEIRLHEVQQYLTAFLDHGLSKMEGFAEWHSDNRYKYYCFDYLYPIERDGVYKKNQVYTLTIRTVNPRLAEYLANQVVHTYTGKLKGLTSEVRILPEKIVEVLYTLTPAVLKCKSGYWQEEMTAEKYEERMKINLIKKWNALTGEKMEEEFSLFTGVEFLNKCPVATEYKGIKLLGDKLRLHIADNTSAQSLAYMALGTGILEMNARGFGFVNYRWI